MVAGSRAATVVEHTSFGGGMRKERGIRATVGLHHPGWCFALMAKPKREGRRMGPNKGALLCY